MKKIVALVLALMLALSMLTVATAETANPVAGKKVAYIMLLPSATIFQMWKDSCADLCAALDVEFDFYFCDGDFNRWMDTINTCAAAGYDGLLVSHGNQDGSYVFLKELTENYPDLKLVCSDNPVLHRRRVSEDRGRDPSCSSRTRAWSPFCSTR